ncbi:EscS/YscS/HrcS family type III secretion system export apparatus protein [Martelella alba]|nr:flagellar biosynthetic protein FliQ [Martelella alba]
MAVIRPDPLPLMPSGRRRQKTSLLDTQEEVTQMLPDDVITAAQNALALIFYLSMPIIAAATAVGLIIAIIQTLIQVQEQTVAFAAKLSAVVVILMVAGAGMSSAMQTYAKAAFNNIPNF